MSEIEELTELAKLARETGDEELELHSLEKLNALVAQKSFTEKLGDFVTGADRQTKETQAPAFTLPNDDDGRLFTTAIGMMTSFDDQSKMEVIAANYPGVVFDKDEKGNFIVDARNIGGSRGPLNTPGIDTRDVIQFAGILSAFLPSGKLASATGSVASNAIRVGAGSAATQGVLTGISDAAGRDVDAGEAAQEIGLSGFFGGIGQGAFQTLGKAVKPLANSAKRLVKGKPVPAEVREQVKIAFGEVGVNADDITDDMIVRIFDDINSATDPDAALATALEREFKIPLTKGQRSMNQGQLGFEDRARAGAFGDKAQDVMLNFEDTKQIPAINQAVQEVGEQIGGGARVTNANQVGGIIKETVRESERTGSAAVRQAFDSVGDAHLSQAGYRQLLNAVQKSVSSPEFVKSKTLAPASNELIGQINKFQKLIKGTGTELKPQHINQIEQMRRTIGAHIDAAANPSDRRTLVVMKNAFDDHIDEAVVKGLFSGDDVAALKNARGVFRQYASLFRINKSKTASGRNIPDRSGELIEKIIASNPTDEEVTRALFGATKINSRAGADLAARLKPVMGPEGWDAVRQAGFLRLVQTNSVNGQNVISGQKTLTALNKALESSPTLMKELYSPQEISAMRRLATLIKRTQPDLVKARANPSGTSAQLMQGMKDVLTRLPFFGQGPEGFVLSKVLDGGITLTRTSQTQQAVRPFQKAVESGLLEQVGSAGTVAVGVTN